MWPSKWCWFGFGILTFFVVGCLHGAGRCVESGSNRVDFQLDANFGPHRTALPLGRDGTHLRCKSPNVASIGISIAGWVLAVLWPMSTVNSLKAISLVRANYREIWEQLCTSTTSRNMGIEVKAKYHRHWVSVPTKVPIIEHHWNTIQQYQKVTICDHYWSLTFMNHHEASFTFINIH